MRFIHICLSFFLSLRFQTGLVINVFAIRRTSVNSRKRRICTQQRRQWRRLRPWRPLCRTARPTRPQRPAPVHMNKINGETTGASCHKGVFFFLSILSPISQIPVFFSTNFKYQHLLAKTDNPLWQHTLLQAAYSSVKWTVSCLLANNSRNVNVRIKSATARPILHCTADRVDLMQLFGHEHAFLK